MIIESKSTAAHRNGNRVKTHCKHGHEFNEENTYVYSNGGRHCKICNKLRMRRVSQTPEGKIENQVRSRVWIANHREEYREYCRARRAKTSLWLVEQKKAGCSICGETFPDCLDFHHRDPTQKKFNIGNRASAVSLECLKVEIAKCDILCSNCHRKLEAAHRNIRK